MTTPEEKPKSNVWKIVLPLFFLFSLAMGSLYWVKSQVIRPNEIQNNSQAQAQPNQRQALPDLEFNEFKGSPRKLSSFNQKVLLINFWATWCGACMMEMPSMVELRKQYADRGFEIIFMNVDESPEAVLPSVLKQLGIDFPVYIDPRGELAQFFDLRAIPLTVIINNKREVLKVMNGEYNWKQPRIRTQIEQWLSE